MHRLARIGDGHAAIDAKRLEDFVLIAPVLKVRPRDRHQLTGARGLAQNHDAIDVGVRKRAQQHAIEHAEDRRRRADAEAERQHDDRGEAGALPQGPDRVSHVPQHGSHRCSSRQTDGNRRDGLVRRPLTVLVQLGESRRTGRAIVCPRRAQLVVAILQMLG